MTNSIFGTDAPEELNSPNPFDNNSEMFFGLNGRDTIFGGFGDDSIDGGEGSDLIDGGVGQDWAVYGSIASFIDLLRGPSDPAVNDVDRFISVENVIGSQGNDYIGGTLIYNELYGGRGDDTIDGRLGGDTIFGGDGDDVLLDDGSSSKFYGDTGDDVIRARGGDDEIYSGIGIDTVFGGNGEDTLYFLEADSGLSIDLQSGSTAGAAAGMTVQSIEAVHGSDFDDYLGGQKFSNNTLVGGHGNDTIDGRNGDNVLEGGQGDDLLIADGGEDLLRGGNGSDILKSRSGDDMLIGGSGDDLLFAGQGTDTLVFGNRDGDDTIRDFDRDEDLLLFQDVAFGSGLGDLSVDGFVSDAVTFDGRDALVSLERGTVRIENFLNDGETPDPSLVAGLLIVPPPDVASILGTPGGDFISGPYGQSGETVVDMLGGDDTLHAASGDVTVTGGEGADVYELSYFGNVALGDLGYVDNLTILDFDADEDSLIGGPIIDFGARSIEGSDLVAELEQGHPNFELVPGASLRLVGIIEDEDSEAADFDFIF